MATSTSLTITRAALVITTIALTASFFHADVFLTLGIAIVGVAFTVAHTIALLTS